MNFSIHKAVKMKKNTNSTELKTVAELLVGYLEERKVEHIFGLCGHTNIAVLSALDNSSIDFVTVRHEQIASHAADWFDVHSAIWV